MKTSVDTLKEPYKNFFLYLTKARTLVKGTEAMRQAGTVYLPKNESEEQSDYTARLTRSVLFNGFKKTLDDFCGRVFKQPVLFAENVPEEFKEWGKNISFEGEDLTDFANKVFFDGLQAGVSYVYVDTPDFPNTKTVEQANQEFIRPYFVFLPAEQILGWKWKTIGGQKVLNQVRILENATFDNPEDPFGNNEIEQVRVLDRLEGTISCTIYRKSQNTTVSSVSQNKKEEWFIYKQYEINIENIPLVPFYALKHSFMSGTSPLEDLIDLNISHWQSWSDLQNSLHYSSIPILFLSGVPNETSVVVSSTRAFTTIDPDANMKYVELSGNTIEMGIKNIRHIEAQMQVLGMQLIVTTSNRETATGEIRNESKETSKLGMIASSLEETLEKCFKFAAELSSLNWVDGGIRVNKDLGAYDTSAGTLSLLLGAVINKKISLRSFWTELQRRGLLIDTFDPELEMESLEQEIENLLTEDLLSLPKKSESENIE